MIDILAIVLAVILPTPVMFWRPNPERVWISAARCLLTVTVFWSCMAWAQHYDVATRVRDGRAHDMGEAASMAGYIFGASFWIIPGTLYTGVLLLVRVFWRIRARRNGLTRASSG